MALTDNLRAYYKLDEISGTTAADSTGNGYTGTLNTYTFNSGGKINYCVSGGATGYGVQCGQALSLTALQPFSLNGWYNLSSINTYNVFWGKIGTTTNVYSYLESGGKLWFVVAKAAGQENIVTWTGVHTAIGTNAWKMLTYTYDGSGNASGMKFYINNTEHTTGRTNVATSLGNNDPDDGGNYFSIGSYSASNAYQTQGKIDEFGVWLKELSTTEITTLYNGGSGLQYPFSSPNISSNFFMLM